MGNPTLGSAIVHSHYLPELCSASHSTEDTGVDSAFSMPLIQMELMAKLQFMSNRTATKTNTDREKTSQAEGGMEF